MPAVNQIINAQEIIDAFEAAVLNPILKDVKHLGNPPIEGGYQCVPSSMMDHLSNLPKLPNPTIGPTGEMISAQLLRDSLINLTRNLTRVGTYTWRRYMSYRDIYGNTGNRLLGTASGKCVFTTAYIREHYSGPASWEGVSLDKIISAGELNAFLAGIYDSWNSCDRHNHDGQVILCHDRCHSNCHSSCHSSCHGSCHSWN